MNARKTLFSAYICWALLLTGLTGHLANANHVFAYGYDAKRYVEYSDFLVGKAETVSTDIVSLRPFLYPLFLGLRRVTGVTGFVLLQILLNGLTVVTICSAVFRFTRSWTAALAAAIPMFATASFTFLALHALAEPLAMFLESAFLLVLTEGYVRKDSRLLILSLFILALAACVKPVFLPTFLFLMLGIPVVFLRLGLLRALTRLKAGILLYLLAIVPIVVQILISSGISGRSSISTAGNLNFSNRYFPAVVGFVEDGRIGWPGFLTYNQPQAEEVVARFPSLADKGAYLAAHPWETAIMTYFLLVEMNLHEGSRQVMRPLEAAVNKKAANILVQWSTRVSKLFSFVHLLFLPVVLLALTTGSKEARLVTASATALTYSIIGSSCLSYWQGDRLVVAALPAWSFLYCVAARMVIHMVRARSVIGTS